MDVINYLLAKRYVDSKISQVETAGGKLDYQVVDSLPETGSEDLIYLVPVGELEMFVKSVGGHGPNWVNKVLEKYPDFNNEIYNDIKDFVRCIIK